jgi:hypothetical protein
MGPENLKLGELYCIPTDGGEPIKLEEIRNIELKTLDVKEYEIEPNFVFNMPNDFNLTLKIISYSKILNRFARKIRRYMRRKDQQEKRRRNAMKTNEN